MAKRLTPAATSRPSIHVPLTADQQREIRVVAGELGITMADLVRHLVFPYVTEQYARVRSGRPARSIRSLTRAKASRSPDPEN